MFYYKGSKPKKHLEHEAQSPCTTLILLGLFTETAQDIRIRPVHL